MSFIILGIIGILVLLIIAVIFWMGFVATAVKDEREPSEKDDPPIHTRVH